MLISICTKIRKIASLIERDNTPSDSKIGDRKMLCNEDVEPIKVKKGIKVKEEKVIPTAPPQQRRPRKQPSHLKKWNENSRTDLMREYMQGYRAEGKDKEVDGPKSTYKKKL